LRKSTWRRRKEDIGADTGFELLSGR
jgi:hypothetical protein